MAASNPKSPSCRRRCFCALLLWLSCISGRSLEADEPSDQFQQVSDFVQQHLLNRNFLIEHQSPLGEQVETRFVRRTRFCNFLQSRELLSFDVVSLVHQTTWTLDDQKQRTTVEGRSVKRVAVTRIELFSPSSSGKVIGTGRTLTTTSKERAGGRVVSIHASVAHGKLVWVESDPLYIDGVGPGGVSKPTAAVYTTVYSVSDNTVTADIHGQIRDVDPETLERLDTGYDIRMSETETEELF